MHFVLYLYFFSFFFAPACPSCLPTSRPRTPDMTLTLYLVDSVAVVLAACRHGSQIVFMTGRLEIRVRSLPPTD